MLELSPFGTILLFLIGGIGFLSITLFAGKLLRPNRPNPEKLSTYESGEDTVGTAWGKFNPRFYIIALIFILFEAELIFLFPWATVFGSQELATATDGGWGWMALVEMTIFISLLALGLAWAWKEGLFDWVRPKVAAPEFKGKVPVSMYEAFNKSQK
jgi:NADH-quinone oxidoreductase subunit A